MTSPRKPVNRVSPKRRPSTNLQPGTAVRRTPRTSEGPVARGDEPVVRQSRIARKRAAARTAGADHHRPAPARTPSSPESPSRSPLSVLASWRRQQAAAGDERSWWAIWRGAVLCTVAAVLLGAFAVVAALRPGVGDGNQAFVDNKATDEVKAAAQQALIKVYSYDPKSLGTYKDTAKQVLTGQALADFTKSDKALDTTISAAQQAQTKADVTADPVGVTFLSKDRAELLVNMTVNATKDGAPQAGVTGPVLVRMQKVGGRWLAGDIGDR